LTRRSLLVGLGLLAAGVLCLVLVGRHQPEVAPRTSVALVGEIDSAVLDAAVAIRIWPLTQLFVALSIIGGGLVTIPLRAVLAVALALRKMWIQLVSFALTWALAEIVLLTMKPWMHRGRPSGGLVDTTGFSIPSGHALTTSATTVAIVLAFVPPGHTRRRWMWVAVAFSVLMSLSRVYLSAHWPSDVVAGTLLGAGIAVTVAALVEFADGIAERGTATSTGAA
jgi:undecaprenyl-diphosphatase